uniref:Uncharacterized protein n=1 Tax=Rhizophora mucronata TaxID=61149 RepID=A0A2P2IQ63_RHIMU
MYKNYVPNNPSNQESKGYDSEPKKTKKKTETCS